MKAKSRCRSWGSSRSVSAAGPMRSSIRSATPARSQYRRAMPVYSSEMSKQVSRPSSGSPRAIASEESPVKVPTSTACRTPSSRVRKVRNAACSGATCIVA